MKNITHVPVGEVPHIIKKKDKHGNVYEAQHYHFDKQGRQIPTGITVTFPMDTAKAKRLRMKCFTREERFKAADKNDVGRGMDLYLRYTKLLWEKYYAKEQVQK